LLRNRRFAAFKFRRQLPIGDYIVDFACLSARLIIEADGSQHLENRHDARRDTYLRSQNFRILRFHNNDILARPHQVGDLIWSNLLTPPDAMGFASVRPNQGVFP
jgi:very-short-patch-repair endonuclease